MTDRGLKAKLCKCCGTVVFNPPCVRFGGIGHSVFNYVADFVECENCGSNFFFGLNAHQVAEFYRTNESGYLGHSQFDSRNRINIAKYEKYRKIIDLLPYEDSVSLCDIGCGGGGFLLNIANDLKYSSLVGIDYDATNLKHKYSEESIDWFSDIDTVVSKFDVVTAFHVLEHIVDLDMFLVSVKKLLHDNSTLVVEVPNKSLYGQSAQGAMYWYAIREHLNHFTASGLTHLLARHGLETIVCLEYWGVAPNCPYPALLIAARAHSTGHSAPGLQSPLGAIETCCARLRTLVSKADVAVWGMSAIALQCLATLNDDELDLLSIMDKGHAGNHFRKVAIGEVRGPSHADENLVIFESASKEEIFLEAQKIGWNKNNIHFLK